MAIEHGNVTVFEEKLADTRVFIPTELYCYLVDATSIIQPCIDIILANIPTERPAEWQGPFDRDVMNQVLGSISKKSPAVDKWLRGENVIVY